MNSLHKSGVATSIVIIAVGLGWLLNVSGILPGVNWVWTGTLGVLGALILGLGGINQLTIIVGPFLIIGSLLSVLRQTGHLSMEIEVPILMVCFGILLLLSYILRLPLPKYLQREDEPS